MEKIHKVFDFEEDKAKYLLFMRMSQARYAYFAKNYRK
jgi:hypothetical protein